MIIFLFRFSNMPVVPVIINESHFFCRSHLSHLSSVNCYSLSVKCHSLSVNCHSLSVNCNSLSVKCHHSIVNCHSLSVNSHSLRVNCHSLSVNCHNLNVNCHSLSVKCAKIRLICLFFPSTTKTYIFLADKGPPPLSDTSAKHVIFWGDGSHYT